MTQGQTAPANRALGAGFAPAARAQGPLSPIVILVRHAEMAEPTAEEFHLTPPVGKDCSAAMR